MLRGEPELNDPADVRRATDLLYHRLKKFGYRLQRGQTARPKDRHIQLLKTPVLHGYQITDTATGKIVLGDGFRADYHQAYGFWEQLEAQHYREKMIARAQKRKKTRFDVHFGELSTVDGTDVG